jgi:alanine racemase
VSVQAPLGSTTSGRAWAEIDLGAVRHNVALLAARAAPASLCAVVKANGYGHGAEPVAEAELDAGASRLAVACVEEGIALRQAALNVPVLLLSEPPVEVMDEVVAFNLTPTVYTEEGIRALVRAVGRRRAGAGTAPGAATPTAYPVHLKVDTGMHRVGAAPADTVRLALAVSQQPGLALEGLWTHLAVADAPADPFTALQAERFQAVADELAAHGVRPPLLHVSNSAGTLAHPTCRYDLVRCGIALYGVPPSPALQGAADLQPALSLRSRVSYAREVAPGDGISYGLRYRPGRPSHVVTVPIGYADGVPWRLGVTGGEVLIGGRRRPIAGSVTMDQILVDCADDSHVGPGDEVVLLGRQESEEITAWEWAERVGTISYEVVCGIGPRVRRLYR